MVEQLTLSADGIVHGLQCILVRGGS
jgi:hypothetical protein